MIKKVLFLFLIISILSCNNSYSEIENIDWLEGSWTSQAEGNTILENWKKSNDSTWTGQCLFCKNGKVLFTEKMIISKRNNLLQFSSESEFHNEKRTVQFIAKNSTNDKLVFQNLKHDFPQQIIYKRIHKDSIFAYITGKVNGKPKRVNFRMSKLK